MCIRIALSRGTSSQLIQTVRTRRSGISPLGPQGRLLPFWGAILAQVGSWGQFDFPPLASGRVMRASG
eukprot:7227047-Pyramimonas_sp.AAC.1